MKMISNYIRLWFLRRSYNKATEKQLLYKEQNPAKYSREIHNIRYDDPTDHPFSVAYRARQALIDELNRQG